MHLQVNDATDPKYKGLEGAIDPDAAPDAAEDASTTPRPGVR